MIDTHIWIWWAHGHPSLEPWMLELLGEHERSSINISAVSCWEIAQLCANSRLNLNYPVARWFDLALNYPGVQLVDLTLSISVEANYLPGDFYKDPADRIIVATARLLGCELLTTDRKILSYPEVKLAKQHS